MIALALIVQGLERFFILLNIFDAVNHFQGIKRFVFRTG